MATVHIDPVFDDAERRRRLFAGEIIVYSHVPEVLAFAEFTRELIETALAPDEPTSVHTRRTPGELADLLIDFKPTFIHHPESIAHVRRVVTALGASAERTHADVPKLRTAFPVGGLRTGIAYAVRQHRDTWYAAPRQQVNLWMPVWPVTDDNIMEFFPRWFGRAIPNNSDAYNYYLANAWRGRIRDFSGDKDTRVHPEPLEPLGADEPRITLVPPVGGIMLFSGDQLHASIPNTSGATRYSVDFRTVHLDDLHDGAGAPAADVRCVGTALRDFRRLSDLAPFTEDEVAPHDTPGANEGIKVFTP